MTVLALLIKYISNEQYRECLAVPVMLATAVQRSDSGGVCYLQIGLENAGV
jgi:hypothetical protein